VDGIIGTDRRWARKNRILKELMKQFLIYLMGEY